MYTVVLWYLQLLGTLFLLGPWTQWQPTPKDGHMTVSKEISMWNVCVVSLCMKSSNMFELSVKSKHKQVPLPSHFQHRIRFSLYTSSISLFYLLTAYGWRLHFRYQNPSSSMEITLDHLEFQSINKLYYDLFLAQSQFARLSKFM